MRTKKAKVESKEVNGPEFKKALDFIVKEKGIDIEVKAIEKLIPFEKMDRL